MEHNASWKEYLRLGRQIISRSAGWLAMDARDSHERLERYVLHKNIVTTIFWIGEPADSSNDHIQNRSTAWISDTLKAFGGADGPTTPNANMLDVPRDKYGVVTSFKPRFNPFYFALPAGEFTENGLIPGARELSPWRDEAVAEDESQFKGRWIEVKAEGRAPIYGQWLDVGPNEEHDYGYVFGDGSQRPKNRFGLHAGLDISPAMAHNLGFTDGSIVADWRFIDPGDVPDGPWKRYPPINSLPYWD